MLRICDLADGEKPREKAMLFGIDTLSNAEILALILGTGSKTESVLSLANRVLSADDSGILFLGNATAKELTKIKGIGKAKALAILAAVELNNRIQSTKFVSGEQLKNAKQVATMLYSKLSHKTREYIWTVLIDSRGNMIGASAREVGSVTSCMIEPRNVFGPAMLKGAVRIILVHNHPSGNPLPSKKDIHATKVLYRIGKGLGIDVIDHIVIGRNRYYSFCEEKLFDFTEKVDEFWK